MLSSSSPSPTSLPPCRNVLRPVRVLAELYRCLDFLYCTYCDLYSFYSWPCFCCCRVLPRLLCSLMYYRYIGIYLQNITGRQRVGPLAERAGSRTSPPPPSGGGGLFGAWWRREGCPGAGLQGGGVRQGGSPRWRSLRRLPLLAHRSASPVEPRAGDKARPGGEVGVPASPTSGARYGSASTSASG
jgi:hypothetical protein